LHLHLHTTKDPLQFSDRLVGGASRTAVFVRAITIWIGLAGTSDRISTVLGASRNNIQEICALLQGRFVDTIGRDIRVNPTGFVENSDRHSHVVQLYEHDHRLLIGQQAEVGFGF